MEKNEKGTTKFKETILQYLEGRASNDPLFYDTYHKEGKNIDDCITCILNTVKKSECNGFTDDEIYSMAVHYYDEDKIDIGSPLSMQVVVNHKIELTEEEKAEAKRDAEERKLANITYKEQKQKSFDLYFTNGLIHIVVLKSIEEFIEEGDELDHCVFENGYYKKADKLILSARKDTQRLETIAISLIDMKVEQSRGYDNQDSDYHKEILNLINSNLKTIKKLVAA